MICPGRVPRFDGGDPRCMSEVPRCLVSSFGQMCPTQRAQGEAKCASSNPCSTLNEFSLVSATNSFLLDVPLPPPTDQVVPSKFDRPTALRSLTDLADRPRLDGATRLASGLGHGAGLHLWLRLLGHREQRRGCHAARAPHAEVRLKDIGVWGTPRSASGS